MTGCPFKIGDRVVVVDGRPGLKRRVGGVAGTVSHVEGRCVRCAEWNCDLDWSLVRLAFEVIGGERWDDQYKPTVTDAASPYEAAVAFLDGIEWETVGDRTDDNTGTDPLVTYGTTVFLDGSMYVSQRNRNSLIAWFASRVKIVHMCMTDGHEDPDDIRWFNDCHADDPHDWEAWWTIDANPEEFWAFAQRTARLSAGHSGGTLERVGVDYCTVHAGIRNEGEPGDRCDNARDDLDVVVDPLRSNILANWCIEVGEPRPCVFRETFYRSVE